VTKLKIKSRSYFSWILGFRIIWEQGTGSSITCRIDWSWAREHLTWAIGLTKSPSPFSNGFRDISSQDTLMLLSQNSIARCWNARGMSAYFHLSQIVHKWRHIQYFVNFVTPNSLAFLSLTYQILCPPYPFDREVIYGRSNNTYIHSNLGPTERILTTMLTKTQNGL